MDFNIKKYLTCRLSGIIAIVLGLIMLVLTAGNLITILNATYIEEVGASILTHILWSIANLALVGFGVSAIAKPVLKYKRTLMGETKKFCWNYVKARHSAGLIFIATALLACAFYVAKVFTFNDTELAIWLFIIQLIACPVYVLIVILQIISLTVKDDRVYNEDYKLITKETSPIDFYNSEIAKEKSYNSLKYNSGKLAGGFAVACGIVVLLESIYLFFETLINNFDISPEGRGVFFGAIGMAIGKIILSFVFLGFGLRMNELPTQKIVPSELYSQRKEGRFRWVYAPKSYFITLAVISLTIAVFGIFGGFNVRYNIHPVIMLIYTVTPVAIVAFYACMVCFLATAILSLISLFTKDNNTYELQLNVYASLYTKTLIQ